MSAQKAALWTEGYYDTEGLVSGEFTEINQKDACKLSFKMKDTEAIKTILMFFESPENERISGEQLSKLGWNKSVSAPMFDNPQGVTQLKCDHYNHPKKGWMESWKIVGTSAPLAMDRSKRLEARLRTSTPSAPPAGRPTAPPAANTQPSRQAPPEAAKPQAGPPPADDTPPEEVEYTKDSAWNEWQECALRNSKPVDVAKWKETINEAKTKFKKTESQFGSEEWKYIFEVGQVPF